MIYHVNINQKKLEMAILIPGKVDFRKRKLSELERLYFDKRPTKT